MYGRKSRHPLNEASKTAKGNLRLHLTFSRTIRTMSMRHFFATHRIQMHPAPCCSGRWAISTGRFAQVHVAFRRCYPDNIAETVLASRQTLCIITCGFSTTSLVADFSRPTDTLHHHRVRFEPCKRPCASRYSIFPFTSRAVPCKRPCASRYSILPLTLRAEP